VPLADYNLPSTPAASAARARWMSLRTLFATAVSQSRRQRGELICASPAVSTLWRDDVSRRASAARVHDARDA
jgi:hypothetical protein